LGESVVVHVCMYECMYVCMYLCMYAYMYMYIVCCMLYTYIVYCMLYVAHSIQCRMPYAPPTHTPTHTHTQSKVKIKRVLDPMRVLKTSKTPTPLPTAHKCDTKTSFCITFMRCWQWRVVF
jgi:hypothetical protein